jgi:hypothetical protein
LRWTKPEILRLLRALHRRGANLSYNAMTRRNQALLSASAYHFGSYRKAIERAGIDYDEVTRRPRWTRKRIILVIKHARRNHRKLHWSAVSKRRDELGKAAFAAIQKRLFGSWARALHAAGLDADDVAMYRAWDRHAIVFELRNLHADQEDLSSSGVQREDPGLYAAAVRHWGSYPRALVAAGIDPERVRLRRSWSKQAVIRALRGLRRSGVRVSDTTVRQLDPALAGASVRWFGSFSAARKAAEVPFDRSRRKR